MNKESSTSLDEQLLVMLLACDKALAAGTVHQESSEAEPLSELRRRLQGNLACIQLLRQVLPHGAAPESVVAASSLPLRRLGRFEIHRELGHGAFGMVFLATDPRLGREVALKVPRPEGLVTEELRERFVREARAAAGLDHPNVVPVYEAGAEGPLCYITSAYCPGITLAEWLANRSEAVPVPLAARLVATLAEAVQHAHERGVIHRDLKPSNILLQGRPHDLADANATVNMPGGEHGSADKEWGFVPRITDFGLAKLTIDAPGQEGGEARTQSGALLGTPNYMAPEQASGKNKEIGPAADVYALGVIFYELLTGRPPFLGETVLDTLEQVRSREPLPPHRLRPKLSRDVETICLKCLDKDPRKRYESAAALGDDLHRYQAGAPIKARPIRAWERGVKWTRRKPAQAGFLAAALALVVVVTGSSIKLLQANEELKQSLSDQEKRLQQSKEYYQWASEAITQYTERVSQDKRLDHGMEGLRKDLLQSALKYNRQLMQQHADDPDMQEERARALRRFASLTSKLGATQETVDAIRESLEIIKRLHHEHPTDPRYRDGLAATYNDLAKISWDFRQYDDAEAAFREASKIRRQLIQEHSAAPEYQSRLADIQNNLGVLYEEIGRFQQAETIHRDVRNLREKLIRDYPNNAEYRSGLAATYFNLGLLYENTNRPDSAEDAYGRSSDFWRQLVCTEPESLVYKDELAKSLTNLGLVYVETDRAERAVGVYRETEDIYQKILDDFPRVPYFQDQLARVYHNLAQAYEELARTYQAETAYHHARNLREQLIREYPKFPDYRVGLARTLNNLGNLYCDSGRAKEAGTALENARAIRDQLVHDYPDVIDFRVGLGNIYSGLGRMHYLQGNDRTALECLGQSVRILRGILQKEPRHTFAKQFLATAYERRGETLARLNLNEDALGDLDRLRELFEGKKTDPWRILRATLLARMGKHDDAAVAVEELAGRQSLPAVQWHRLARICSLCSSAARGNAGLTPQERNQRAERYAVRSVEFLQNAKAAGYFESAPAIEEMRKDKDLETVRERRDFQELFPLPRPKDQPKIAP